MVGIALGVSALIIIMSVMNGFQDELRTRILGVASHIEITSSNNTLAHWEDLTKKLQGVSDVKGSAPYIDGQGMLVSEYGSQGIMLRGISSELEGNVDDLEKKVKVGHLSDLKAGTFNIILGIDAAKQLGIVVGDKVNILIPQGSYTPAGTFPRMRQFNVVGIFEIGMYEYDSGMALMNLEDAQKCAILFLALESKLMIFFWHPQWLRGCQINFRNQVFFISVTGQKSIRIFSQL
jgi:lipoprotein-releasing system permease protein